MKAFTRLANFIFILFFLYFLTLISLDSMLASLTGPTCLATLQNNPLTRHRLGILVLLPNLAKEKQKEYIFIFIFLEGHGVTLRILYTNLFLSLVLSIFFFNFLSAVRVFGFCFLNAAVTATNVEHHHWADSKGTPTSYFFSKKLKWAC